MIYGQTRYRRIRLAVHPEAPFRRVLRVLEELQLPGFGTDPEHLKYALLEMINNSIRAHRDNSVDDQIMIGFEHFEGEMKITVEDRGPGFDPGSLPYRLDDDPNSIDLNSPVFEEYRKRNNYRRFGMGLPMVLRTFDVFTLVFQDERGQPIPWTPGLVRGTVITVSKYRERGAADGE